MAKPMDPCNEDFLASCVFPAGRFAGQSYGQVARDKEGLQYIYNLLQNRIASRWMNRYHLNILIMLFSFGKHRRMLEQAVRNNDQVIALV